MEVEYFGDPKNPRAILIRKDTRVDGIQFFSPLDFGMQLGLMSRPSGYIVPSHIHNEVSRNISETQEVLILRKGTIRVNLFDEFQMITDSIVLLAGDVILLASGGLGIEMLEDSEILEVKQGPYLGQDDKKIFGS